VGAVSAVVDAQRALDDDARLRATEFVDAPAGTLAVPPLWFALDSVSLDVEMSSQMVQSKTDTGVDTSFLCRMLNPTTVGLFGYAASTGMRVRLTLSPQRLPLSPTTAVPPTP